MTKDQLDMRAADNIRILSAAMVEKANSGHPGGAMGGADFIHILFSEFLNFDPDDPRWPWRDRFFLDPGHMSPMLYSVLMFCGKYSMDDIKSFRQWGSVTPGHPELDVDRGIENTSGPLGQGHVYGIGAAIAERFFAARFGEWTAHKTFAFLSDGSIQEEISQGGGRIAGHLGLSNLIMFYDSNDIQLSTETSAVTSEDTAAKYEAWGWRVMTIDGSDHDQIRSALKSAVAETEKPVLIIGKTIMGKGALDEDGNSFERQVSTHGQPLSKAGASITKTIQNLGGDPENPFHIFPEVSQHYEEVLQKKRADVKARRQQQADWELTHPEEAKKLASFFNGELPALNLDQLEHKPDIPSRSASGTILGYLAGQIENMVVSSADLSNSDKTGGFLANSRAFSRDDFSGGFLESGVSELTMAAIANGLALHGGIIPVCGTFFVFSDYQKPALRMAALMEIPTIFVWSHDAFRVGEDGPTHQPVEQEAQIRLLEKVRNHSHERSMLVLRPADAYETNIAWEMALANKHRPTGLIFSRQVIPDIKPKKGSTRAKDAEGARKGAYVVSDFGPEEDIVFVGNGSEVSTLMQAAEILHEKHGITVRVVSVISEGLFRDQTRDYQQSVIPGHLPKFGLTAGIPFSLRGLVGPDGIIHGVDHFGYSAPFQVLDEKFGFTPEFVVKEAMNILSKD